MPYTRIGGKKEVGLTHLVVVFEDVPRVGHPLTCMVLNVLTDAVKVFLTMQASGVIESTGTGCGHLSECCH